MSIQIKDIRSQFPILLEKINNKPLVYFDNAATSQKPIQVINALNNYYSHYNANIHRGLHSLADKATAAFEESREKFRQFINAKNKQEIIITSGTTESINLVAQTYGRKFLNKGDEIIISTLEHHSNIVPWQMLCEEKGCVLKVIPINDDGEIILSEYKKLLSEKTKIVSVVHVSNALGTVNPIAEIIKLAHEVNAKVLIDGAQSVSHFQIDVQALDVDFFVTSAHKFFGPTGVGLLYGKEDLLNSMPPYKGGGEMIKEVTFEKTTYNVLPYKFEAGTPNIADAIVLKNALDFMESIDRNEVLAHDKALLNYAESQLKTIEGLKIIGNAKEKIGLVSFVIEGLQNQDIGMLLDQQGIAIRTGHHCTQPLMKRLNISGTCRASFAIYNTEEEVDILIEALKKAIKLLK